MDINGFMQLCSVKSLEYLMEVLFDQWVSKNVMRKTIESSKKYQCTYQSRWIKRKHQCNNKGTHISTFNLIDDYSIALWRLKAGIELWVVIEARVWYLRLAVERTKRIKQLLVSVHSIILQSIHSVWSMWCQCGFYTKALLNWSTCRQNVTFRDKAQKVI